MGLLRNAPLLEDMPTSTMDRRGLAAGLTAYLLWGFAPLFWKLLGHVPTQEVLAWRIVFSALFMFGALAVTGALPKLFVALRTWRTARVLLWTTALISVNWFMFIWSVANNRVVDASLGYYINPLVNVLLGSLFLKETLSKRQWVAVAIAALAVANQAIDGIPWVSLGLAFTFAFYGLARKTVDVSAATGLTAETLLVSPFAIAWLCLLPSPFGSFPSAELSTQGLLALAGPVTAFPLLFFAMAARRLKLATVGMLQYIAPSMQLVTAVVFYDEPFGPRKAITFALIWVSILLFAWPARKEENAEEAPA